MNHKFKLSVKRFGRFFLPSLPLFFSFFANSQGTLSYSFNHNIAWGFSEIRLTRFMDYEGLLLKKFHSLNLIPGYNSPFVNDKSQPGYFKEYNLYFNPTLRPQQMKTGREIVFNTILNQGITNLRLSYMHPVDGGFGVKPEEFMTDTDHSGAIEPNEYLAQMPDIIASTMSDLTQNFNIIYCFNDMPYNINIQNDASHPTCLLTRTLLMDHLGTNGTDPNGNTIHLFGNSQQRGLNLVEKNLLDATGVTYDYQSNAEHKDFVFNFNKFYPEYLNQRLYFHSETNFDSRYDFNTTIYENYLDDLLNKLESYQDASGNTSNLLDKMSFEIGNEANLPVNFLGTPSQFIDLAARTFLRVSDHPNQGVYVGGWSQHLPSNYSNPNSILSPMVDAYYAKFDNLPPGEMSYHIYLQPNMDCSSTISNPKVSSYGHTYSQFQNCIKSGLFIAENPSPFNKRYEIRKSVITEWNPVSSIVELPDACPDSDANSIDELKNAYINGPNIVYELGRLIEYATKNNISEIYLHNLMDVAQDLGFFNLDGTPKDSWNYFKKVHDVVKEGFTFKKWDKYQGGEAYMEIISNKIYRQLLPNGWYDYKLVLAISLDENIITLKDVGPKGNRIQNSERIIDEFKTTETPGNAGQLGKGGWTIYKRVLTYEELNQPIPVTFTPNPVACENVTAEWENLNLNIHAQLRIEIRNLLTGELLYTKQLNREARSHAIDVCNFQPGTHVATITSNGQVVAQGNLMISY